MITTFAFPMRLDIVNRLSPLAWLLWRNWIRGRSLRGDPWRFALPLERLTATGISDGDLQWMLQSNLLRMRCARSSNCHDRAWLHSPNDGSYVMVAEMGAAMIEQYCLKSVKPKWDIERRELSVQADIIKVYRQPSHHQETVLAAFQEDGWNDYIYDPLPRVAQMGECQAKIRLRKTVEHLNRAQQLAALCFSVAGNAQQVRWSFRHKTANRLRL